MKGSCSVQVRPTQELGHLRSDSNMLRGSEFPGRCSREAGWAGQGGGHPEARAMGRGGPGGGWQRAAGEDDALRGQTARATRSSSARRRPGPPGAAPRHASLAGERWGVPVGPPGSRPHLHPETCSIPAPPGTVSWGPSQRCLQPGGRSQAVSPGDSVGSPGSGHQSRRVTCSHCPCRHILQPHGLWPATACCPLQPRGGLTTRPPCAALAPARTPPQGVETAGGAPRHCRSPIA